MGSGRVMIPRKIPLLESRLFGDEATHRQIGISKSRLMLLFEIDCFVQTLLPDLKMEFVESRLCPMMDLLGQFSLEMK